MKKIFAILLALGLTSAAHAQILLGDVNQDKTLDVGDVTMLVNMILGKTPHQYIDLPSTSPDQFILESRVTGTLTIDDELRSYQQGRQTIDLGLSDGTLWAACNIGAELEAVTGNLYAWGETATKDSYTAANYQHTTYSQLTLKPADDAAVQLCGGDWTTPTAAQVTVLLNECNLSTTTRDGLTGLLCTSKANGRSIFLPAGNYWCNAIPSADNTTAISLSTTDQALGTTARYTGLLIRPVITTPVLPGGYGGEGDGSDSVKGERF